MQKLGDVVDMKANPELFDHEPTDSIGRPQLGRVAESLGPPRKRPQQPLALCSGQLGRPSWTRLAPEACLALRSERLDPPGYRLTSDSQSAGDIGLVNSLAVQSDRLEPTVFEHHSTSLGNHARRLPQQG